MRIEAALVAVSFLLFSGLAFAQHSGISTSSYNALQAREYVANATAYVRSVNESAYLIFYPNLTTAYSYLSKAGSYSNSSPSTAVSFAYKAAQSARNAYQNIQVYKTDSLAVVTAFTIATALVLYMYMKRIDRKRKSKA